ncbi:hypothetical protein [Propionivibrio dicarboxylicus]|uniref:hypothetical protein n=1 Tax=Propionivibrio dicarboxylicus TaxID=83767 RepID=UPI0015A0D0A5|nr:hypothetical protein [Propionivibrio dicarboxylicus]
MNSGAGRASGNSLSISSRAKYTSFPQSSMAACAPGKNALQSIDTSNNVRMKSLNGLFVVLRYKVAHPGLLVKNRTLSLPGNTPPIATP